MTLFAKLCAIPYTFETIIAVEPHEMLTSITREAGVTLFFIPRPAPFAHSGIVCR